MIKILLFGTQGCHLCEEAEAMVSEYCKNNSEIDVEYVDIAEHDQWQESYAVRIPVLFHPESESELGWPFEPADIIDFMRRLVDRYEAQ